MGLFETLGAALNPQTIDEELKDINIIKCDRCGNSTPENKFDEGRYICTNCDNSWQCNPLPY